MSENTPSFDPSRCVVAFNCNDGQVAQASLLIKTLRNEEMGRYNGRILAITTSLSDESKSWFASQGVEVFEKPLDFLDDWKGREFAANTLFFEHERGEMGKSWRRVKAHYSSVGGGSPMDGLIKDAMALSSEFDSEFLFEQFKNKRFSKLNVIPALESLRGEVDWVLFCDTDIVYQRPVDCLFDSIPEGAISGEFEVVGINPGMALYAKDARYNELFGGDAGSDINLGEELNIGVLAGRLRDMVDVWVEAKSLMLDERYLPLYRSNWHEQDFFRLLRVKRPQRFGRFPENHVYHACGYASSFVEQREPMRFGVSFADTIPVAMHFAGGVWRQFENIRGIYLAAVEELYVNAGVSTTRDKRVYASAFEMSDTGCLTSFVRNRCAGLEKAKFVELGACFGSTSIKIESAIGEMADTSFDIVDGCVYNNDWEGRLFRSGEYKLVHVPLFGMPQLEIIERYLGAEPRYRLYLQSKSEKYKPREAVDFALLNRMAHPLEVPKDVERVWGSLKSGGWLILRRFTACPNEARVAAARALDAVRSEIDELHVSMIGDFLAIRKV